MVPIVLAMLGRFFAYIDPASGSILLQVILAGAVGALGYFLRPILRCFRFLRGKSSNPPEEADDAANKPDEPPKG
jgi:hypothetical protein